MAHKIKKTWYADFRFCGERIRKRSPENSRAGAKAYEAMLRGKLARGESIDEKRVGKEQGQTFEQFAWQWFDEYVVSNNKQQEQRKKMYTLRSALIPFFGKMPVEKITSRDVERYKVAALAKGVSPKTVNNYLAVFGKCMRTAHEWLELSGTPPKVALLKCPPPKTDYLSADECGLLLANADGTVGEMILLTLRTGMRQGEVRGLQWASIDWQNRMITVRHNLNDRAKRLESPKSNRERRIPMDADVYEMLFKRKKETGFVFLTEDDTPFDSQRLLRQLDKVREKAGLRKFAWHILRHTFATQLGMLNAPLNVVQQLLGHSTITMTMRYAHVDSSGLRAAIDLLNPKSAMHTDVGQPVGSRWIPMIQRETRNA